MVISRNLKPQPKAAGLSLHLLSPHIPWRLHGSWIHFVGGTCGSEMLVACSELSEVIMTITANALYVYSTVSMA